MLTTALGGLLSTLLPILIKGLIDGLLALMAQQQTRNDQIALGQSRVAATQNLEAADAERRAAEAAINVPAIGGVIDDMHRGVF